ncbi:hypothetical protein SAMN05443999_1122 [Roseovarius azorensis]|uniref:Uncharacterized protein n=1 Tax=Roseovarius azorensis TaxID=1287727 RepID=A0A1H7V8V4_9RHOB|nr:hypothetical protein SAMN05443999_1122 [Roseovarius azorensis]
MGAATTIDSRLARMHRARDKVALMVVADAVYAPIFQRLDALIAEAETAGDVVARARAVVAQNAIRSNSSC